MIPRRQTKRERLIQAQPSVAFKPLMVRERLVLIVGEGEFWLCGRRRRRWQGERAAWLRRVLIKHGMTFFLRAW